MAKTNFKGRLNGEKRIEKRYIRTEKKIDAAKQKSPIAGAKAEKKFGYNTEGAKKAGLSPDATGHWPSRNPSTGEIFKGPKHPTIGLTKKAEKDMGYKVVKKKRTLYSFPKKNKF